MHPYWIQKIEEARRSSVIQFWTVVFLIIILPILLVMKSDGYMILGIGCFIAAGLRFYWTGETMADRMNKAESPAQSQNRPADSPSTQLQPGQMPAFAGGLSQQTLTGQIRSDAMPNNGVPSGPDVFKEAEPEGFFTASIEPGEPLAPQPTKSLQAAPQVDARGDPEEVPEQPAVDMAMARPRHFHDFAS